VNIEERLRADMDQSTRDIYLPDGLALKAYRHSQKRRATVRTATATGAVTVLAAGTIAVAGAAGAFSSAPAKPTTVLVSKIESALAPTSISKLIGHTRMVFPAGTAIEPFPGGMGGPHGSAAEASRWSVGYTVGWAYGKYSKLAAYSASGRHVFDVAMRIDNGIVTSTAVIYGSRTWWSGTSAVNTAGQSGCDEGDNVRLPGGSGNPWPAFIRSQLACGAYAVAGHQMVDGVDALKLAGPYFSLWVDPSTYLPLELSGGPMQWYFQWLPATKANLAQLNEQVPVGFQQVSPPARP